MNFVITGGATQLKPITILLENDGFAHIVVKNTIPHILLISLLGMDKMTKDTEYRIMRYSILGFALGGAFWNRPEDGLYFDNLGDIVFIAYVMIFSYLLAKWCLR